MRQKFGVSRIGPKGRFEVCLYEGRGVWHIRLSWAFLMASEGEGSLAIEDGHISVKTGHISMKLPRVCMGCLSI